MTRQLLLQWRSDESATYRNWFLWQERIKNFRSIRRGITEVVDEIKAGTFGVTYRGSSLETVVKSIAKQRQMFKGADHAFLWKPKLRIPDIYEKAENQLAFAQLLDNCMCCNTAEAVINHIRQIDKLKIKGLGAAVANLLYFLHPTIVPPFNTAIVKGYNLLKQANVKLGSWDQFLAMREGILAINESYRESLSNDLGAIGGFLYDIKLPAPAENTGGAEEWRRDCIRQKLKRQFLARQGRWILRVNGLIPKSSLGCAIWARLWGLTSGLRKTTVVAYLRENLWDTAAWMIGPITFHPRVIQTRCG